VADAEFETFVAENERTLRRAAYLLCGDWQRAEDAAQDALIKLYRSWDRLDRGPHLRAHALSAVTSAVIDEARRPWRRARLQPVPETAVATDHDLRLVVMAALGHLAPRRRACVVLRYFSDLSVEEVAGLLSVSPGTVKSQTARGLSQLRDALADSDVTLLEEIR
jgi:RNA polymerase sigma-70 factor (sigma-E family)